ncbi:hypothetical protein DUNSADRAFT_4797 [Dunaliella salina]|uniref:Uncharacterized protein n=1 Tax=Dunaliella salina TaxID=3046 RepID=A0ABQ7FUM3_DUNSA|nr:hypothetical protein DUNSADRAFT_4797 [Dunaliella salina]|eukprot:KAF5826113.1 hypothetical protein DUNSADRAFT_4797 [Dunaliella salina]
MFIGIRTPVKQGKTKEKQSWAKESAEYACTWQKGHEYVNHCTWQISKNRVSAAKNAKNYRTKVRSSSFCE